MEFLRCRRERGHRSPYLTHIAASRVTKNGDVIKSCREYLMPSGNDIVLVSQYTLTKM